MNLGEHGLVELLQGFDTDELVVALVSEQILRISF